MTPTATARKAPPGPVAAAEQTRLAAAGRVAHVQDNLQAARARHQELLDRLAAGDDTVTATELTAADAARHRAELLAQAAVDEQTRAAEAVGAAHTAELIAEATAYLDSDPAGRVKELVALAQRAVDDARAAEQELITKAIEFGLRFRDAGLSHSAGAGTGYRGYDRAVLPWAAPTGFTVDGRGVTAPSPWSPR